MDREKIIEIGRKIKNLIKDSWLNNGGLSNPLVEKEYEYHHLHNAYYHQTNIERVEEGISKTKIINLIIKSETFENFPFSLNNVSNLQLLAIINKIGEKFKKITINSPTTQNWIIHYSGSEIIIDEQPIKDRGFYKHEKRII